MSQATFLVGDAFDQMADIQDGTVDLVLTSPPFLALRSYLPSDHPDKDREIGSEATPAEFLDTLLALTAEWARVLAPHGSIAVELGDSYAGSGGSGGDYNPGGLRDGQQAYSGSAAAERITRKWGRVQEGGRPPIVNRNGKTQAGGEGWPLPKSLAMIPQLYAVALAYGINPLTGESSPAGRWRVRNNVAWVRPNPPVGALADKYRPATSYLTVATKARDRWFDLDAVRRPSDERANDADRRQPPGQRPKGCTDTVNPAGTPPLDWWEIPPGGYPGAHYATWPAELCRIPVESMCPRRVCTTCGAPSRRITEVTGLVGRHGRQVEPEVWPSGIADGKAAHTYKKTSGTTTTTTGWTTCGCPGTDGLRVDGWHTGPGWRPGIVLDPFAGSGTTLAVAHGLSRHAIGVDIDARNAELFAGRLGMFATEKTLALADAPAPTEQQTLWETTT